MKRFVRGCDGAQSDRLAIGVTGLVERFDDRAAVANHQ
jgi:hypothetical protein